MSSNVAIVSFISFSTRTSPRSLISVSISSVLVSITSVSIHAAVYAGVSPQHAPM